MKIQLCTYNHEVKNHKDYRGFMKIASNENDEYYRLYDICTVQSLCVQV